MVHWSFILGKGWLLSNNFCKACQNCLHLSFVIVHKAVRTHLLLLCESPPQCYHAAQTTPTWTKPIWHVLQKIIAVHSHPWPNMNELCTKLKWTNYVIMYWNQLCYIFFQFLRNFESNRGFLLRNSIKLILKTWKNLFWHVLQKWLLSSHLLSNICVTNVSYESEIIVLSFPVISFVILIFVFQRFEIKSGFPFFDSHCIVNASDVSTNYLGFTCGKKGVGGILLYLKDLLAEEHTNDNNCTTC